MGIFCPTLPTLHLFEIRFTWGWWSTQASRLTSVSRRQNPTSIMGVITYGKEWFSWKQISVGGIPNSKEVCIIKWTLITTFSLPLLYWFSMQPDASIVVKYKAILSKYKSARSKYKSILSKYKSTLSKYKSILSKYKSMLSKYKSILSKYKSILFKGQK